MELLKMLRYSSLYKEHQVPSVFSILQFFSSFLGLVQLFVSLNAMQ